MAKKWKRQWSRGHGPSSHFPSYKAGKLTMSSFCEICSKPFLSHHDPRAKLPDPTDQYSTPCSQPCHPCKSEMCTDSFFFTSSAPDPLLYTVFFYPFPEYSIIFSFDLWTKFGNRWEIFKWCGNLLQCIREYTNHKTLGMGVTFSSFNKYLLNAYVAVILGIIRSVRCFQGVEVSQKSHCWAKSTRLRAMT